MVKALKNRKNNKRKPRRRFTKRRGVMSFPPIIPFNRCFMNVVLRHIVDVSLPINSYYSEKVPISDLFKAPWDKLKPVFSQARITKAVIYISAGVGMAERGFHALNLSPWGEIEISDKTTFPVLSSLPGTKMSRIGRMVSAEWHPTGSDERAWFKTDFSRILFVYSYLTHDLDAGGKASAAVPVNLTFDYHMRLRGINYASLNSCVREKVVECNNVQALTPQSDDSAGCSGFQKLDIDS